MRKRLNWREQINGYKPTVREKTRHVAPARTEPPRPSPPAAKPAPQAAAATWNPADYKAMAASARSEGRSASMLKYSPHNDEALNIARRIVLHTARTLGQPITDKTIIPVPFGDLVVVLATHLRQQETRMQAKAAAAATKSASAKTIAMLTEALIDVVAAICGAGPKDRGVMRRADAAITRVTGQRHDYLALMQGTQERKEISTKH